MQTLPPRDRLHALVDALPDGDLAAIERLLETVAGADPALRTALLAPVDDEPLTDAEVARIDRAARDIARGEYVSDEDLDALFSQHAG